MFMLWGFYVSTSTSSVSLMLGFGSYCYARGDGTQAYLGTGGFLFVGCDSSWSYCSLVGSLI